MSITKILKKVTVPSLKRMKEKGEKISALTAYDCLMATMLDEAGIDIILVGDSLGMVIFGFESTLPVTMEMMLHHVKAVKQGVNRALLVADMPFLSYQSGIDTAINNAGRFLQETGAEAVKLEGGDVVADIVEKMVKFGIPVMGHLGLTPQSINQFGSYDVVGRQKHVAQQLLRDAKTLEDAGAFSIVLEKISAELAKEISENIKIPTIGIGAGKHCDGQVLVSHDMLGIYDNFNPKFVRRYAELANEMRKAFSAYIKDVKENKFPDKNESY